MSSRWYPIYKRGNPQLRVFLPNFWLKMIKPGAEQPKNVVQFVTSSEMTNHDIKNYLERIYKVGVVEVRSAMEEGEFRRVPGKGYITKDEDFRRAFVTLEKTAEFQFPDICLDKELEEDSDYKKFQEQIQESYKTFRKRNQDRQGLPGWFSI